MVKVRYIYIYKDVLIIKVKYYRIFFFKKKKYKNY